MTTSTDVLAYVRHVFPTEGFVQRQKILYYAQAWHATWFGRPLFDDPVMAWEMGPVAAEAWRADKNAPTGLTSAASPLHPDQQAVVDAVWDFYGCMSGAALSELSHSERPWIKNYWEVSPLDQGRTRIPTSDMVKYYSAMTADGAPTPERPSLAPSTMDAGAFDRTLPLELDRWSETLALLADR